MEIIKIKTENGEMLLNIHDDLEKDINEIDLEDTVDLSEVVKFNETK